MNALKLGAEARRTMCQDPVYAALIGVVALAADHDAVDDASHVAALVWAGQPVDAEAGLCASLHVVAAHFALDDALHKLNADATLLVRRVSRVHLSHCAGTLVTVDQPDVVFRYHGVEPTTPSLMARVLDVFEAVGVVWARVTLMTVVHDVDLVRSMGCELVRLDLTTHTFIPLIAIERFVLLHHNCELPSNRIPFDSATHCRLALRTCAANTNPRRVILHNVAANPIFIVNRFVSEKRAAQ